MTFPPPIGSRPTIEWLHVDRLSVDDTYQRTTDNEASRRLICRIARGFDWRLFGVLMVARRPDDAFLVLDGQHRLSAALTRGDIPDVPCCVSRFDTPQEEARMFVAANRSRKPLNRLDDFHAALAAGDLDALTINRLVEDAGLRVARVTSAAGWQPGEVAFTAAIARVLKTHGEKMVAAPLEFISDSFEGQKLTHGGSVFNGLVEVIAEGAERLDAGRLREALAKYGMDWWGGFVAGAKGGRDRTRAMKEAILMAYAEVGSAERAFERHSGEMTKVA